MRSFQSSPKINTLCKSARFSNYKKTKKSCKYFQIHISVTTKMDLFCCSWSNIVKVGAGSFPKASGTLEICSEVLKIVKSKGYVYPIIPTGVYRGCGRLIISSNNNICAYIQGESLISPNNFTCQFSEFGLIREIQSVQWFFYI